MFKSIKESPSFIGISSVVDQLSWLFFYDRVSEELGQGVKAKKKKAY